MTDRVDICNLALNWLGANPITALSDDSDEARSCTYNYDIAVEALLEEADWSFAKVRFTPARLLDEPDHGWNYAYSIPGDVLRVLKVYPRDYAGHHYSNYSAAVGNEQALYELEDRKILTNEDAVFCIGLRDLEQEGVYSKLFVQALAAKLAMQMAFNLTRSSSMEDRMERRFDKYLETAQSRDGAQGRNLKIRNTSLTRARASGTGR